MDGSEDEDDESDDDDEEYLPEGSRRSGGRSSSRLKGSRQPQRKPLSAARVHELKEEWATEGQLALAAALSSLVGAHPELEQEARQLLAEADNDEESD